MDAEKLRKFLASLNLANVPLYHTPEVHDDVAHRLALDTHIPKNVIAGLPMFDPEAPPLFLDSEEFRCIVLAWWLGRYQVSTLESSRPPRQE